MPIQIIRSIQFVLHNPCHHGHHITEHKANFSVIPRATYTAATKIGIEEALKKTDRTISVANSKSDPPKDVDG